MAGGLAWLAVSGEDAPDLIASAPITNACVLRAKAEAVMGAIVIAFSPFVIARAVDAPVSALVSVTTAAALATSIQFWFRVQAKRSRFRRRQTSSRIATFAEALSSCSWAGAGALAAASTWLAAIPGLIALAVITSAWIISPATRSGLAASDTA